MTGRQDPRARLATYNRSESAGNASAEVARFYATDPDDDDGTARSWYLRGQNFVLVLTEASPGAVLERTDQVDEYLVLLEHASTAAEVAWQGRTESVPGHSIVMVPPGDSAVTLPAGGRVTRLFTVKSEDLVARCPNASSYEVPKPNVAPYEAWPEPVGGWKVRSYSLDVDIPEGGFAKMFRNTNFMVNVFRTFDKPRPRDRMSPHAHDDFEQCSLVLSGDYVHSLRWEWGADLDEWREDEHIEVGAPSAVVIPAATIHSSRWVAEGENRLVDIFSPPRVDFSKVDGWVLNAHDYPMPEGV